jgi:hypothetical protein
MEMEAVLLTVTLLSLMIAIFASVLAWRVMRGERLRSEARIAALAADLGVDEDERPLRVDPSAARMDRVPTPAGDVELNVEDAPLTAPAGMFAEKPRERSAFRLLSAVGVAALIIAAVIVSLVVTSDRQPSPPARHADADTTTPPPADVTLELIALGHEREADRLTVRGVVRGKAPAADERPLTAVVLLFNREGTLIASGRADVKSGSPDPAGERTFVVSVPSAGDVGRYRVSFRSDDQIVPHVDRRAQPGTVASEAGNARPQI